MAILHQIGRRGQALRRDEPTHPVVETVQVGRDPADIDRNEDHASALLGDGLTIGDGRTGSKDQQGQAEPSWGRKASRYQCRAEKSKLLVEHRKAPQRYRSPH
jgi:hypothetical protein